MSAFSLDSLITLDEACEELRRRLQESVKLRMISEVPLAFLSGGVTPVPSLPRWQDISLIRQHLFDSVRRSRV